MLSPGAVHSNASHQTIRIRRKVVTSTLANKHKGNSITGIRLEASKVVKGQFHNISQRNSLILSLLLLWDVPEILASSVLSLLWVQTPMRWVPIILSQLQNYS